MAVGMSAELPISPTIDQAYSAAVDDVNRWRGHCIECCARIERATGKALAAVSDAHLKTPPVMFGERMKALRVLVGPQGSHSNPALLKCLEDIEGDLALRNVFVHASGSVWVHPTRGWLWSYRFDPMQKGKAMLVAQIERREAESIEQRLGRAAQSLRDRLQKLQVHLEAVTE